jgi:hypothetical protein
MEPADLVATDLSSSITELGEKCLTAALSAQRNGGMLVVATTDN